jgi:GTP-binding protein EngB required for normal cell division
MAYEDSVNEELLGNFELLCSIVRQNTNGNSLKVDLSKIDDIINKKIPDTLKENAPEDFYELYTDFKSEYDKFRDFILYDRLIGKNIVALGGGFSSGKSSFLNAFMGGKHILPEGIDPSTSVPTYIVKGEKHEVVGINVFDSKVEMKPRDIKKIAHGFGEVEDDDENIVTDAVTLGHILESIFFSTPLHKYDNIAFLDTPGYSKPDSEKYSIKTDEQIARGQLNSSNYILWFIQADAGTITDEDIKFIKTLREDIPKLIIVNKADKKNLNDLKNIMQKIKSTLDIKCVRYVDVLAFSSKPDQIADCELGEFVEENTTKIKEQIEEWNSRVYESNFARNFKKLFVRCKDFYEDEIDEESRKLTRLNTSITKLAAEDIDDEILSPLRQLVREAQNNVNELKGISGKLKKLQDEFFTEIKFISDIVGISMPEPSEIDLLQDKVQNPLQLIEEYKKEKGIKTDKSIVDMLNNIFEGVEPTINKYVGGSEYNSELVEVIKSTCDVRPEDIHINDVYKNTQVYAQLLSNAIGG